MIYQIKFLIKLGKVLVRFQQGSLRFGEIMALHTQKKVNRLKNSPKIQILDERYS